MDMFGIDITRRRLVVAGGAMLVSAIGGGVAGYLVAAKKLEAKYAAISEREIEEAKAYYVRFYNKEYSTPEEAVEALIPKEEKSESLVAREAIEALRDYRGESETALEERQSPEASAPQTVIVNNIFRNPPAVDEDDEDGWDYEAELRNRTEEAPYIITDEEYFSNEKDYDQIALTYYEGDDVVADGSDIPMDDVSGILGDHNLRFGYGSKDHNMVYIRNDQKEAEYEIVRSGGKFAEEVMGLQHSDRPRIRKFRPGDDE